MNTAKKTRRTTLARLTPEQRAERRAARAAKTAKIKAERQAAADAKADTLARATSTMITSTEGRRVWEALRSINVENTRRGWGACASTACVAEALGWGAPKARKVLKALEAEGYVENRGRDSRASWHVLTAAEAEARAAAKAKRKAAKAALVTALGCDGMDVLVRTSGAASLDLSAAQVEALLAKLAKLAAIEAITG